MKLPLLITALTFSSATATPVRSLELFDVETPPEPGDANIIGGQEAAKARYPYVVSLQYEQQHFCGGSLVAPDMVLTAAHCQGGPYNVVIGRHDLTTGEGESIAMSKETPYPWYNDDTLDGDWMVVKLQRSTTLSVPFVKLNVDTNSPSSGQSVTVMGWGDMTDGGEVFPDVLMSVNVNVVTNQVCNTAYGGDITANMLCAAASGKDSCQGDSGGPLIIPGSAADGSQDVQVGVVSWGDGCAQLGSPGVYSRVSRVFDWIKSEVCSQSAAPPNGLCGTGTASPTKRSTPRPTQKPVTGPVTAKPTNRPTPLLTQKPVAAPSEDSSEDYYYDDNYEYDDDWVDDYWYDDYWYDDDDVYGDYYYYYYYDDTILRDGGALTAAPTNKPTSSPTKKPTNKPTSPPTKKPTPQPTNRPVAEGTVVRGKAAKNAKRG